MSVSTDRLRVLGSESFESYEDPSMIPFAIVVGRCCEESSLYLQHVGSDPQFCFEFFRRAFLETDPSAWEAVYQQYAPLVRSWVKHHAAFRSTGEDPEYFVNGAFTRMWRAFANHPEKFARMRSLAALLRYLKLCVQSEITDQLRKAQNEASAPDDVVDQAEKPGSNADLEQTELWRLVQRHLNNAQEHTAVYARFVVGMKPNEICAQYPAEFSSVRDVYTVLQNVLRRLRRSDKLLRYFADPDGPA